MYLDYAMYIFFQLLFVIITLYSVVHNGNLMLNLFDTIFQLKHTVFVSVNFANEEEFNKNNFHLIKMEHKFPWKFVGKFQFR